MKSLFDSDGRYIIESEEYGYLYSRKYFALDKDNRDKINEKKIFTNLKENFNEKILISEQNFFDQLKEIDKKINKNEDYQNLKNCISVPFIIPKMESSDIGTNLEKTLLPALQSSYKKKFPEYDCINHIKDDFKGLMKLSKESRCEKIVENCLKKNIVGKIYFSLNEFSFLGAEKAISNMDKNFNLSGPYEVMSALVGVPDLLYNEEKYPPLLWFSAVKHAENTNIGFHIEPYGYNLHLNKRSHLNLVAEYWWHSISSVLL